MAVEVTEECEIAKKPMIISYPLYVAAKLFNKLIPPSFLTAS